MAEAIHTALGDTMKMMGRGGSCSGDLSVSWNNLAWRPQKVLEEFKQKNYLPAFWSSSESHFESCHRFERYYSPEACTGMGVQVLDMGILECFGLGIRSYIKN